MSHSAFFAKLHTKLLVEGGTNPLDETIFDW